MYNENEEKLLKDFPHLYRRHNKPISETSMCLGFDCGDGWFDIIYDLSRDIETQLKKEPCDIAQKFAVEHVKEKFGTLTYYIHMESEAISRFIRQARAKSAVTCESCGQPGKLRRGLRQQTLCDGCAA